MKTFYLIFAFLTVALFAYSQTNNKHSNSKKKISAYISNQYDANWDSCYNSVAIPTYTYTPTYTYKEPNSTKQVHSLSDFLNRKETPIQTETDTIGTVANSFFVTKIYTDLFTKERMQEIRWIYHFSDQNTNGNKTEGEYEYTIYPFELQKLITTLHIFNEQMKVKHPGTAITFVTESNIDFTYWGKDDVWISFPTSESDSALDIVNSADLRSLIDLLEQAAIKVK